MYGDGLLAPGGAAHRGTAACVVFRKRAQRTAAYPMVAPIAVHVIPAVQEVTDSVLNKHQPEQTTHISEQIVIALPLQT